MVFNHFSLLFLQPSISALVTASAAWALLHLARLFAPVLLLPRHMRALPPLQQQLIAAHEQTHLRPRAPLSQHAATLAAVLLWFIPASSPVPTCTSRSRTRERRSTRKRC